MPASKKLKVCTADDAEASVLDSGNPLRRLSIEVILQHVLPHLTVVDVYHLCLADPGRFVLTPRFDNDGNRVSCIAKTAMHQVMDRGLDKVLCKSRISVAFRQNIRESFSQLAGGLPPNSVEITGSTMVQAALNKDWTKTSDVDLICTAGVAEKVRSWLFRQLGLTLASVQYGYKTEAANGTDNDDMDWNVDPIHHVESYVPTPEDGEPCSIKGSNNFFEFSLLRAIVPVEGRFTLLAENNSGSDVDLVKSEVEKTHELVIIRGTHHLDGGDEDRVIIGEGFWWRNPHRPIISITTLPGVEFRFEPRLFGSSRKAVDLIVLKSESTIEDHKCRFDMNICKASFNGEMYSIPTPVDTFRSCTRINYHVYKNWAATNYFRLLHQQCQRSILSVTRELYSCLRNTYCVGRLRLDPKEKMLVLFSPRYDECEYPGDDSELSEHVKAAIHMLRNQVIDNVDDELCSMRPSHIRLTRIASDRGEGYASTLRRHNYMVDCLGRMDKYTGRGINVLNAPMIHENLRRRLYIDITSL